MNFVWLNSEEREVKSKKQFKLAFFVCSFAQKAIGRGVSCSNGHRLP